MGLYVSAKLSFNCISCLLILYIWYLSYVSNIGPLFCMCKIFIVFSIVLLSYVVSNMCWANLELCPLFLMPHMCSLNLILNVRPVCPTYFCGQFPHFNCCTPLRLYLSLWVSLIRNECCFWFCKIFQFLYFLVI
jgi:hypothetical protein